MNNLSKFKLKVCPNGCASRRRQGYHVFPDFYEFCPYCGSRLELAEVVDDSEEDQH